MDFKTLGLNDQIIEAISYMGFEKATPIQEQTMPSIIAGKDVIACAQTGTGKTAAFILPILHKITEGGTSGTSTLVIVPTRELATQIDNQVQGFSYFVDAHSATVLGGGTGAGFEKEKTALTKGTDIIIATPGKLLSHLRMGYVKFDQVRHFILDEADRMLDMGFRDDIDKIASFLPKERQNLLFSATMPLKIRDLARDLLVDPFEVSLSISKPAAGVTQRKFLVHNEQKIPLVENLLKDRDNYKSIIIFCSRKVSVNEVYRTLARKGYSAKSISSDLEQVDREKVLSDFRSKKTRIVVATDVLSRGIDIKDINLVINYDVPNNPEDYVHRIGRTARAETKGEAITLVSPMDMRKFHYIEELIESIVDTTELPNGFSKGPEWSLSEPKKKGRSGGGGGGRKGPHGQKKNFKGRNGQSKNRDGNRNGNSNRSSSGGGYKPKNKSRDGGSGSNKPQSNPS